MSRRTGIGRVQPPLSTTGVRLADANDERVNCGNAG